MTRKALLFVLFFVLVAFRVPAFAASSVSAVSSGAAAAGGSGTFAHAWTSYSDKEKKSFLFGLATAVLVDATIIRLMLAPALLSIFGRANWWFPGRSRG